MDVVCLGELLIDMFPSEVGKRLVEVEAFRPKPGGAPANVAVGLARLGIHSAFIGKVGDDAFGHHLVKILAAEKVETRGMRFDKEARTTMAFIASPDENTAEFVFYRNPGADMLLTPAELDHTLLSETKALHFGSLSLVDDPIRAAALEAIKLTRNAGGLISLDVNYRPTLWDSEEAAYRSVTAVLPSVNLVKVNEVELKLLSGTKELAEGSKALLQMGPQVCVITLGGQGSYFAVGEEGGFVPSFAVKTVDATGCGDAFVAGLLACLVRDQPWRDQLTAPRMRENLVYANAVGALTAMTQGAIPALPTANMVDEFLAQQVD